MINARKEFLDVAFQYPAGFRVVLAYNVRKRTKPIQGFMRTLAIPTRKRICNKRSVEKWIKLAVDCVVKQSVPNSCFVNVPRFGVADPKRLIFTVLVYAIGKVSMER